MAAAAWTRALMLQGDIAHIDIFAPLNELDVCRQLLLGMPPFVYGCETSRTHLLPLSDIPCRLRSVQYDLLHTPLSLDLPWSSYIRSRYSRRVFPVTCSQHGISYSFALHPVFIKLLTAQIYPCDAIVCLSQASKLAMQNRLSDLSECYSRIWGHSPRPVPRLELIPWGIDTERFSPRDSTKARLDLDLPLDRPIVLCIGRIRIQDKMDCTPLLLAFDQIRQSSESRPLLVLAGAGSEHCDYLFNQADQLGLRSDFRVFVDFPSACLPDLYAACDVFVSPADSLSESFGLTIIEAMACGRPVVASDWDGYRDIIVHGETGFRIHTQWANCLGELNEMAPFLDWTQQHLHAGQSLCVHVGQMARAVSLLLENEELRQAMGRQARSRVEGHYSWRSVLSQWYALWGELATIAGCLELVESDSFDYLLPRYFEQFAHYASEIIDDNTPVSLTRRGKSLLAGRTPIFLHPWTSGFLNPENLRAILLSLKPTGFLGASLTVGDLLAILHRLHGLGRHRALMHIMWLAKYDLLTLGNRDELEVI